MSVAPNFAQAPNDMAPVVPEIKSRRAGILPNWGEARAALIAGLLFAVAFPPFKLFVPVFLCLVPIGIFVARCADRDGHAWNAARAGFWFGVLGYGTNLYWIAVALSLYTKLAFLGYLGTLVWLSPFVAVTVVALFFARRTTGWPFAILLPVIWVASELVLNYLSDLSFPWLPLGLSVARTPVLAQMAELSGVRGVSFWIAAVNGLLVDAWLLRQTRGAVIKRAGAIVAIFAIVVGYGTWRMSSITLTPFAKIAVVQPNIPEQAKLTIENPTAHVGLLTELTREELRRNSPDLVLWPEAALDRFLWQYPLWRDSLSAAVAERPTPLITGFLDSNIPAYAYLPSVPFRYYNAAMLMEPFGSASYQPPYRKQFLVPIVERVPFLNPEWFRHFDYFGGFARGTSDTPFSLSFGKVGIMICYESIFPQLARAYARNGAAVLANITNDAWFQRSNAPYQHFSHLILRAIENRLPAVRAANTGISGYIDPLGRVRAETPIFVQRTATYTVEAAHVTTPYTRWGDWVGMLCLVITAAVLAATWTIVRRQRHQAAQTSL